MPGAGVFLFCSFSLSFVRNCVVRAIESRDVCNDASGEEEKSDEKEEQRKIVRLALPSARFLIFPHPTYSHPNAPASPDGIALHRVLPLR